MIHTAVSNYNVVAWTKFVLENTSKTHFLNNFCDGKFYVSAWLGHGSQIYEGIFR